VTAVTDLTPQLERARGAPRALPGGIGEGALLVIDVQGDFADPEKLSDLPEESRRRVADAVQEMEGLIETARRTGLRVVFVRGRDSVPPWGSVLWLIGREEEGAGLCVPGTPGFEFWRVAPAEGEAVVTKSRYSGFVRTELEELLGSLGVTWLAVCGLTTECCVASTAWDAMQRDFRVVIVGDACAAYDQSMHTGALEIMAENVGIVVTAAELQRVLVAASTPAVAREGG
jgi:ureidoacrylate peracid hydrolase